MRHELKTFRMNPRRIPTVNLAVGPGNDMMKKVLSTLVDIPATRTRGYSSTRRRRTELQVPPRFRYSFSAIPTAVSTGVKQTHSNAVLIGTSTYNRFPGR